MQPRLTWKIAPERLFPPHSAYMARTSFEQVEMVGGTKYTPDSITALLLGMLNGRATVRHRSGVTDEALAMFDRAGIEIHEDMRVYDTADEAERIADDLIREGWKLFWPYPLREGRFPDGAHVITPELYRRLNAKQNLHELVPANHLAPRALTALNQLSDRAFDRPVFLKLGGDRPTGSGYGVRYCPDAAAVLEAAGWFEALGGVDQVIVEDALDIRVCWCAGALVEPHKAICFGAAEQVFEAPAKQEGSAIDPEEPFPEEAAKLTEAVAEAARKRGFIGVCGMDIGQTTDGDLIVFDPNFRFNASTVQVLLHDSAAKRAGLPASVSIQTKTQMEFSESLSRLAAPVDDGWFVPTRLLNGDLLSTAGCRSVCTGFVLGADRADAMGRRDEIRRMLRS